MAEGYQWPESQMLLIGPTLTAARTARDFVRHRAFDRVPQQVFDDMVLVASELVSNAVTHGDARPVALKVLVSRSRARIAVTNAETANPPNARVPAGNVGVGAGSGLELALVRRVADQVRLRRRRDRVTVVAKFRF